MPPHKACCASKAHMPAQRWATNPPLHLTHLLCGRCAACGSGIRNDLRRQLAGSGEIGGWRTNQWGGGGEYRFHCQKCNIDLCSSCYDRWKAGGQVAAAGASSSATVDVSDGGGGAGPTGSAVHSLQCSFTIEAPITNSWGSSSYGPGLPPPPPVNSRNRRGPWG